MMDEDQEYILTLQGIFNSCSASGSQRLNRDELASLCDKLDVQDQTEILLRRLLGDDPRATVDFDTFQEEFLTVLSETVQSSDEEEEPGNGRDGPVSPQVSPKLVLGDKKYGRRSRPETDTEAELSDTDHHLGRSSPHHQPPLVGSRELSLRLALLEDEQEEEASPEPVSPKASSPTETAPRTPSPTATKSPRTSPEISPTPETRKRSETFEAEGQMDQPMSELAAGRHNMELIWQQVGVSTDDHLTLEKLAAVCEKIGMDDMNSEELQHLFDKLDVCGNGQISFEDFLHGLVQSGNPTSPPARQVITPRQKLRMSLSGPPDENRQTPSLVSAGSGLFSDLDVNNTGFVKADDIIELWESFGIPQGAEILEYLNFSLIAKVSLTDLSYALEQELHTIEDDNATYQAAIATYDYELRYLRGQTDHLTGERDKLHTDLADANSRITLLVKEGDERYSALERSKARELSSLEGRYQEQIRLLQAEIEHERDTMNHQTSNQRLSMEMELDRLKDDETKLKEKLGITQKEFEKMEREILDLADKCNDLELQNIRQQKELEATAELHLKLEEMESSREIILDEQQKFSEQKLLQVQVENQELKDKADEMTMEIEDLRLQVSAHRKQKKPVRASERRRAGSNLSEYARHDDGSASDEASDVESPRSRQRKQDDVEERTDSVHAIKLQDEVHQLKTERESLQAKHSDDVTSLKAKHGDDVTSLQSQHEKQLDTLKSQHEDELKKLRSQNDNDLIKLRSQHDDQVKDLKQESDKKIQDLTKEHDRKCESLRTEHDEKIKTIYSDHEDNIKTVHSDHENKIRVLITRHSAEVHNLQEKRDQDIKELQKKIDDLSSEANVRTDELQALNRGFSIERKDIEDAFKMEIAELEDRHIHQKNEIIQNHKRERDEMEAEFEDRLEEALEKKEAELQEDFEQQREEWVIKAESEKNLLSHQHRQEVERLTSDSDARFASHKDEFSKEMENKTITNQSQIEELQKQKAEMERQMKLQKEERELQFEEEKNSLIENFEAEKTKLSEKHGSEIYNYENMLATGKDGLEGQLRTDFFRLLDQEKEALKTELQVSVEDEILREREQLQQEAELHKGDLEALHSIEKKNLENDLAEEKRRMTRDLEQQQQDLAIQMEREKQELLEQISREKAELEQEAEVQRQQVVDLYEQEKLNMEEMHQREKEELIADHQRALQAQRRAMELDQSSLALEREVLRKEVEEELQEDIERRLEDEFLHQVELLKHTFQEEREQLEDQVQVLQDQVDEAANQNQVGGDQRLKEVEQRLQLAKDAESRYKRQADELNRMNSTLKDDKKSLEDEKNNLRKELEDKVHRLTIEKEEAVSASHMRALQSSRSPSSEIDKAMILREIEAQKRLLEDKTGTLQRQIEGLERNSNQTTPLQLSHDRLVEEKHGLEKALHQTEAQNKALLDQSLTAEQYKARAGSLEEERDALRKQLEMTSDRLTDTSTSLSLANSEHQRELQDLRQKLHNTIDMEKHNKLNSQYLEAKKRVGELEAALEKRAAETTKALMGTQSDHQRAVQQLEGEKESAERQLSQLQQLLDGQVARLKQHLDQSAKRDLLVKDLYVENCELNKSLEITEKREKAAERKVYDLEEMCHGYQRLISRLTPLAMA